MTPENFQDRRSLDARFAGGLAWTAGAKWSTQILTWTALLAVTRLLSPSDYGVGQMAGTLTGVSNVMAEFGIGTAVLHMPELSRKTLAQLHTFSCLLCAGVFALATAASPLVASFFHTDLLLIFVVNNTQLLLTGFQAVPMGLLARDMDYRKLSLVEAAGVLVQSVITVFTAWLGWGYWALAAGTLSAKLTGTILVCSWKHVGFARPRWKDIHAPARLGRQAATGRVAWSLYTQADGIVVGRVLGVSVLGYYRIAMNLASAPAQKVSELLMRTAAPLFANVKDNHFLVRRYFLILAEILTLSVMPLMVGLAIVTPLAVPVVFGTRWISAIDPLRWLALFMIVRTMGTLTEQVLISQKMTRVTMRMSLFNFVVMPIAFVAGARWQGMGGVAAAWLVLSPITIVTLSIILHRTIQLPFRSYVAALVPSLVGSTAMCLSVLAVRQWLLPASWSSKTLLAVQVGVGGAVYGAVLMTVFRQRVLRYVRFLQDMRKGKKSPSPALTPL
jgi:O-antigen/teichoic acid export membrane protein